MSGGYFSNDPYYITNITNKLFVELTEPTIEISEEDKKVFVDAIDALQIAYVYTRRIDRYLSGDDGQDTFHKRLKEDLEQIRQ
jgi:hypothetical protein